MAQQNDIPIVPDTITRAVGWLQNYQTAELQKLENAATQTRPYKVHVDNLDALVFHTLVVSGSNNESMQNFLFEDRGALSSYGKSLVALAVHRLGNQAQRDMLRRNIEQFLVEDLQNETAYLRGNEPGWYWYGSSTESMAMYLKLLVAVDPQHPTTSRLVKYLLNNRANATYWNSTRDTAMVIEALAEYLQATEELSADMAVDVMLDGKRIGRVSFDRQNLFTVNNTVEIEGRCYSQRQAQFGNSARWRRQFVLECVCQQFFKG